MIKLWLQEVSKMKGGSPSWLVRDPGMESWPPGSLSCALSPQCGFEICFAEFPLGFILSWRQYIMLRVYISKVFTSQMFPSALCTGPHCRKATSLQKDMAGALGSNRTHVFFHQYPFLCSEVNFCLASISFLSVPIHLY